jgi:hypothetical protein
MPYDKVTACVIAGTSNLTQENWSKWNGQTMWGRPAVKTAAIIVGCCCPTVAMFTAESNGFLPPVDMLLV